MHSGPKRLTQGKSKWGEITNSPILFYRFAKINLAYTLNISEEYSSTFKTSFGWVPPVAYHREIIWIPLQLCRRSELRGSRYLTRLVLGDWAKVSWAKIFHQALIQNTKTNSRPMHVNEPTGQPAGNNPSL